MDEHEGSGRAIADSHLDVQLDARSDRDAPLDDLRPRRARRPRHGANPSIADEKPASGAEKPTLGRAGPRATTALAPSDRIAPGEAELGRRG